MTGTRFEGPIEQAAAGDIRNEAPAAKVQINNVVHLQSHNEPAKSRPLVSAQRRRLNQLVGEVAEVTGDDPRDVWSAVHRVATVESIEQITAEQFGDCESYLEGRLAEVEEASECRRLAGRILRLDDARRQKAEAHALLLYGTSRFLNLNRDQLLAVLREVSGPQEVACGHDCTACREAQQAEFQQALMQRSLEAAQAVRVAERRGWQHVALGVVVAYCVGMVTMTMVS